MKDDQDLIERLNKTPLYEGNGEESDLPEQAASRLQSLGEEVKRLREALKPFSEEFDLYHSQRPKVADNIRLRMTSAGYFTVGDLRRAQAALSTTDDQ